MSYFDEAHTKFAKKSLIDYADEDEEVVIFGTFTNWKPRRMTTFLEFIENIDKDKPNFIQDMKEDGLVKESVMSKKDLEGQFELSEYVKRLTAYRKSLRRNWQIIITKNLKYKRPAILNLNARDLIKPQRLFVLPIFIKSGKHNMIIKVKDKDLRTQEWHFQQDLVDFREEDVSPFTKQMKSHFVERKFCKEQSVFKDWHADNPATVRRCIEHDTQIWKLPKHLEEADQEEVLQVIIDNYGELKEIYINQQSASAYPAVTMSDITSFLKSCQVLDAG